MKNKTFDHTRNVGMPSSVLRPVLQLAVLLVLISCLAHVSFAQGVAYIQSLNPPSAAVNSGDVTLTVTGANLCLTGGFGCLGTNGDAVINFTFGGTTTALAEVSACTGFTTCTVKIPSAMLQTAGVAIITAFNPNTPTNNIASNPVFFPITSSTSSVGFLNKPYVVGNGPQAIAEGDFNGDGKPDLVVVNSGDNTVSIVLGNGDGTFQCGDPTVNPFVACPTYPTGHNPQAVVVGDFNNDGNLDFVVANKDDNDVILFTGNGHGTFTAAPAVSTIPGVAPVGLVAVDLNFDGNLDLFVVNQTDQNCTNSGQPTGGSLESLFGDGTGNFSTLAPPPALQAVPNICLNVAPGGITTGDFNGDGFPDFAISSGSAPSGLICASGSGAVIVIDGQDIDDTSLKLLPFDGASTNACAGPDPSGIAAADFNKDNKLDLAVTNTGGKFSILLNAGNGSGNLPVFTAGAGIQASFASYNAGTNGPTSIIVGDLNGDGNLDVAMADPGASMVATALGKGDGTFAGGSAAPSTTQVNGATKGRQPIGLVAAPFNEANGAGRLDLASANHADTPGTITLMLQEPQLTILCVTAGTQGATFGCFGPTQSSPNTPGPPNLLFGQVDVTNTSASLALLVLNNGGANIPSFPAMSDSGNFLPSESTSKPFDITKNTCSGNPLNIGATCEIDVAFSPVGSGDVSATLEIPGIAAGSFEFVSVSGTGLEANGTFTPQGLSFNPTYLANAPTGANLPAPPQLTATLANTGNADLQITSVEVAPGTTDFTLVSNGCVTTLQAANVNNGTPAGTCMVTVSLTPTHIGLVTGSIKFDTGIGPLFLQLQGQGSAPTVSLSNPPLLFSNQQVGTMSAPQTITLTNIGNGQLFFASSNRFLLTGSNPGDFALENTTCLPWPQPLNAGSSCTVTITFTPLQLSPEVAARSATLVITDNDGAVISAGQPSATDTAGLNGVATWPVVSYNVPLSPALGMNFGGVPFETTGASQSFMISNIGTAPLVITSIASTDEPEFHISGNTCPASLAVNTNCLVTAKFTPGADGVRNGTIVITDNNLGTPAFITTQTILLTGTGTDFSLSVTPPSSVTIPAGKTATYKIVLTAIDGFNNPVTYSCAGGPPHSNCFISGVSNGSATIILSTSKGVNHGTFGLTFTATYTAVAPAGGPPGNPTLAHSANGSITIK